MTAFAIIAGAAFVWVMTVLYGAIRVAGDCGRREDVMNDRLRIPEQPGPPPAADHR
jgi:hypothetical protein